MRLLLLGAPGSGKGTQGAFLADHLGVVHVSSGELFREHVAKGTELGRLVEGYLARGELVPDDLVIEMIFDKVSEEGDDGFLLDGFPRTIAQADALAEELDHRDRKLTAVLLIDAPDDVVIERLSGRRQCSNGHLYHVRYDPPKRDDVCDQCGKPLRQRDDDRPEVIEKRLRTYHEQTEPLIEYYEQRGLLRRFDGTRDKVEVHDHIRATLATLRLEERL